MRRLSGAGLGVWEISFIRMGVGLLAIGLYLILFHRERLRIRLRDLWCFAGAGVLSLMCMNWYGRCWLSGNRKSGTTLI